MNATFHVNKTQDKESAYRAIINTWLRADRENIDICRNVIQQNKRRKAMLSDVYGRTHLMHNDMRIGLSLPTGLYYALQGYERMHGNEFMTTKKDLHWFARKFSQFTICERI